MNTTKKIHLITSTITLIGIIIFAAQKNNFMALAIAFFLNTLIYQHYFEALSKYVDLNKVAAPFTFSSPLFIKLSLITLMITIAYFADLHKWFFETFIK